MAKAIHGFLAPGPFRADQLRPGDPYELSDGHPVRCMPTGGREEGELAGTLTALREALCLILAQRGLDPDPDQGAAIADCADPDRLRRWLARAAVATRSAEVFVR